MELADAMKVARRHTYERIVSIDGYYKQIKLIMWTTLREATYAWIIAVRNENASTVTTSVYGIKWFLLIVKVEYVELEILHVQLKEV